MAVEFVSGLAHDLPLRNAIGQGLDAILNCHLEVSVDLFLQLAPALPKPKTPEPSHVSLSSGLPRMMEPIALTICSQRPALEANQVHSAMSLWECGQTASYLDLL
jgi:hypothetical protein